MPRTMLRLLLRYDVGARASRFWLDRTLPRIRAWRDLAQLKLTRSARIYPPNHPAGKRR